MTEAQIKHMVDRFLTWKLPDDFNPDGGISFKATFNEHTAHPMRHEPNGTNILNADQADAMVRHMIEGLPSTQLTLDKTRAANTLSELHNEAKTWRSDLSKTAMIARIAYLMGEMKAPLEALTDPTHD